MLIPMSHIHIWQMSPQLGQMQMSYWTGYPFFSIAKMGKIVLTNEASRYISATLRGRINLLASHWGLWCRPLRGCLLILPKQTWRQGANNTGSDLSCSNIRVNLNLKLILFGEKVRNTSLLLFMWYEYILMYTSKYHMNNDQDCCFLTFRGSADPW